MMKKSITTLSHIISSYFINSNIFIAKNERFCGEILPGWAYNKLFHFFAHGDSYFPEKGMIWHVFERSNGQNRKNSYDMPIVISDSYFTALFTPSADHP